jgi:hypothetical protein
MFLARSRDEGPDVYYESADSQARYRRSALDNFLPGGRDSYFSITEPCVSSTAHAGSWTSGGRQGKGLHSFAKGSECSIQKSR